jgi:beta-glucanase (GH16 family)
MVKIRRLRSLRNVRPAMEGLIVEFLLFGRVTAVLEAATGAGIVSAFILQSDDLDEIDWEWLGGDTAHVQSNYFSKGDTTSYDRGAVHNVDNPQSSFHSIPTAFPPNVSVRN